MPGTSACSTIAWIMTVISANRAPFLLQSYKYMCSVHMWEESLSGGALLEQKPFPGTGTHSFFDSPSLPPPRPRKRLVLGVFL